MLSLVIGNMKISILIFTLFLTGYGTAVEGSSAPFQVAIHFYSDVFAPRLDNFHLCNGVIIHESFILTTAHCVDTHILDGNLRQLRPAMIYVIGGNLTTDNPSAPGIKRDVANVTMHPKYNPVTLENDIALIKLQRPLPLHNHTNMKWIQLDHGDFDIEKQPCFITILNDTSAKTSFSSFDNIVILDKWYCNKSANFSSHKTDDICSQYIISADHWCNATSNYYKFNPNRGSSLVCNNILVGLLSAINPPDDMVNFECSQRRKTYAFYTSVEENLSWILKSMGDKEPPGKGLAKTMLPENIKIIISIMVLFVFWEII